ncbi:adenine deaminase [Limibaculum sp. FT325]|uniref:adenine deaminase n=1 Tax=Thermohalobaculum sediminis TaxID=2939436 RepID=UPI0020BD7682|nr:adenine deaminase [Limibaculum sediminis]MCL5775615.1 adenine deaminase [Limibaculum sediminis]
MTDTSQLSRRIAQALGETPADRVIRGGRMLDLVTGDLRAGDIAIAGERIVGTVEDYDGAEVIDARGLIAVPGFIDGHVHLESSLVTPFEFERVVVPRGTTTAICDPHEAANVMGTAALRYFLDCAEAMAMDLRVQLSSCVPATAMETSGAELGVDDLLPFASHPKVIGLAELMNFPGVLARDPGVLAKAAAFQHHIDGHAPLLSGRALNAYLAAGVRNDHETSRIEEGREKLAKGMHILLREGSVARDVAALAPLMTLGASPYLSFCTDDRSPLEVAEHGHIDHAIRHAIAHGAERLAAYRAATWSAARHFGLTDRGLIAPGQRADIVLLSELDACRVERVILGGRPVDEATFGGRAMVAPIGRGSMKRGPVAAADFAVPATPGPRPVIEIIPGKIITGRLDATLPGRGGLAEADPAQGIAKIAVIERHGKTGNIGRGFVRGFGLAEGALASSVGHDSHNICVAGMSDADMAAAVNRLIALGGGFVAAREGEIVAELALPLMGLISDRPAAEVEAGLRRLRDALRAMGCPLDDPFIQLAFLPLPVIPSLKITDLGLFDVDRFALV